MKHKYSDFCVCQTCTDFFNKELMKAIDKEAKKKKKRKGSLAHWSNVRRSKGESKCQQSGRLNAE